jgi:hypothetical protein
MFGDPARPEGRRIGHIVHADCGKTACSLAQHQSPPNNHVRATHPKQRSLTLQGRTIGRRVSGVVLCARDLERAIHLPRNSLDGAMTDADFVSDLQDALAAVVDPGWRFAGAARKKEDREKRRVAT